MNRLADRTEYVGRLGQIAYDEDADKVQCLLCGRWFRGFGGSHLRRVHGWTLARYRLAFQLSVQTAAVSAGTSALFAAYTRRRVAAGELPPPPPTLASAQKRREIARRRISPGRSLGALRPGVAAELHRRATASLTRPVTNNGTGSGAKRSRLY